MSGWRGQLYPGYLEQNITPDDGPDPMWELDPDTIKVTHERKK